MDRAMKSSDLPLFDELPSFHEFPGCAWGLWGDDDQLGTVNLLTDEVVQDTMRDEIRTGRSVSLNWPINFPAKPAFKRKAPEIRMMPDERGYAHREDEIALDTQSGSQWDGMTHLGVVPHGVFYNNTHKDTLLGGTVPIPDPKVVDPRLAQLSIHHWAEHGICGRGVLLDLVEFYGGELPYDPWATHAISVEELEACARKEGVSFRTGDVLLVRVGHIRKYNGCTQEERDALAEREDVFAGLAQTDDMKRFLWNNHFAAVASDQPALESWPPPPDVPHLHQTILGLWGMPIGEMFDLEKLSEVCKQTGRYTFFFSSWPIPIIGGCAAPPSAAAMF